MTKTKTKSNAKAPRRQSRVWKGNADLEALLVPIRELKSDPANARRHPERNQLSIRRSLEAFGQQKPVVVDSEGVVRAGNGTLEQARELGWTHLARTRSELTDDQLKAYALADNTSSDFAEFDPDVLRQQLEELDEAGFDLDAAGLALSEVDLEDLGAAFGDGEEDKGTRGHGDKGGDGPAGVESTAEQWKIIITCTGEKHQADLLTAIDEGDGPRLAALLKGQACRALSG